MLNERENVLRVINWEEPEYMPISQRYQAMVGVPVKELFVHPYAKSGKDAFGVDWLVDTAGAIPDPRKKTFDDVTRWEEFVRFPDLDSTDMGPMADKELANIDRTRKMVTYCAATGVYERLEAFMGFEELLCAIVEEPEACMDFFDAMSDYNIALFKKLNEAYHLDIYINFDDVATAIGMFISPETYRQLLWPYQKKIADAVTGDGVIYAAHTCGHCEDVLGYYVELGTKIWNSAQPMNDLKGIQERFKGKLVIEGGWDTTGECSFATATEDEVREEVRRCAREYGVNGGFILGPTLLSEKGNPFIIGDPRVTALFDEYDKVKYCLTDRSVLQR